MVKEHDIKTEDFETATHRVHGLSRSFGTLRTNASELVSTLIHIQECENICEKRDATPSSQEDRLCDISLQISSCRAMQRWIESYERRVQVQINLVCDNMEQACAQILLIYKQLLHRMNLQESLENKALAQQNRDIAEQSKKISRYTADLATKTTRDTSSMITIAAVTMFFLPATFVSVSRPCSR